MAGCTSHSDDAMIALDHASPLPPYEQVRAQFAAQIASGILVAGTRLPTVRGLADELGLAANTVARAYRELESAGLVQTRGRKGTTVSAVGDQSLERVQAAAYDFAALAKELGVGSDVTLRMVQAALAAIPRL